MPYQRGTNSWRSKLPSAGHVRSPTPMRHRGTADECDQSGLRTVIIRKERVVQARNPAGRPSSPGSGRYSYISRRTSRL